MYVGQEEIVDCDVWMVCSGVKEGFTHIHSYAAALMNELFDTSSSVYFDKYGEKEKSKIRFMNRNMVRQLTPPISMINSVPSRPLHH